MLYLLIFLFWIVVAISGWRVFVKAGFKGYLGLLFLIPMANFVALLYLAHAEWPAIKDKNNE